MSKVNEILRTYERAKSAISRRGEDLQAAQKALNELQQRRTAGEIPNNHNGLVFWRGQVGSIKREISTFEAQLINSEAWLQENAPEALAEVTA